MSSHLQIPAGPRSVQSHLESENKGRTARRSRGRDACLQCGPRAWQWQRHLLEPPGVWGLCHCGISVSVIFTMTVYKESLRSCSQVRYECLSDEIKIGDYYLRLLLEEDESEETNAIKRSWESHHFHHLTAAVLSFCTKTRKFFFLF